MADSTSAKKETKRVSQIPVDEFGETRASSVQTPMHTYRIYEWISISRVSSRQ